MRRGWTNSLRTGRSNYMSSTVPNERRRSPNLRAVIRRRSMTPSTDCRRRAGRVVSARPSNPCFRSIAARRWRESSFSRMESPRTATTLRRPLNKRHEPVCRSIRSASAIVREPRDLGLHDLQVDDAVHIRDRLVFDVRVTAHGDVPAKSVPVRSSNPGRPMETDQARNRSTGSRR